MADIVSPETRSRMMSGIRGRDTKPELAIRRGLHARGFRYRLGNYRKNGRPLPGRPDLVFPRLEAVVFVHGCFWHGHDCHLFRMPSTRRAFWEEKIAANIARDHAAVAALAGAGWRIGTVWECALKGRTRLPADEVTERLAGWLRSGERTIGIAGEERDAA